MKKNKYEIKDILHALIPSLFGILIFLFPVKYNDSWNIPIGILSENLAKLLAPFSLYLLFIIINFSALSSLFCKIIIKLKINIKKTWLISFIELFNVSTYYLIVKIISSIFIIMCFFKVGPKFVLDENTGFTMISLLKTLISWFLLASFMIPFLTNFGIMEFFGTLLKNFTKPLFGLPGRSTIDLLTSWIGNCNVGTLLTISQYEKGFYSAKEAIIISTCFSSVSLPFCLVVSAMLNVDNYFFYFYLEVCLIGLLLAIIIPRIPPISKFNNNYYNKTGKMIHEDTDPNKSKLDIAIESAISTAKIAPDLKGILKEGSMMFSSIIFNLTPIVMCYGTISLALVYYTKLFNIISMPMAYYLKLLGVENYYEAAPATIIGFSDMIIPAILGANIAAFKTRFIIGVLSLVQIIYMSEVGTILITSSLPLKFKDLLIIFLEKTLIALPFIVLLTNIIFR